MGKEVHSAMDQQDQPTREEQFPGKQGQSTEVHLTAQTAEEETLEQEQKQHAEKTEQKANAIRQACKTHDLNALVSYTTSEGGFLSDELRRLAWPIILGSDDEQQVLSEKQERHVDEGQVQLDVDRSFVYYPQGEHYTKENKQKHNY